MRKQVLSIFAIVLFALLAVGSKTANLGRYGFNDTKYVEEASPQGDYVEEKDGTKHYGKKISYQSGLLLKDLVKIDGEKYKMADVYGFRSGSRFYVRYKTEFPMRIVRGKINIYKLETQSTTWSTDASGRSRMSNKTQIYFYGEKNGDGNLVDISRLEDIQKLVADCPAAAAMADLSKKEMRRTIKADRDYLNSIFEMYNRKCN